MSGDEAGFGLDPQGDADHLAYDYCKWITTLALLALGGVLSLSQTADLALDDWELFFLLAPLCLAGVLGLTGAEALVMKRLSGCTPRLRPVWTMRAAMAALGMGVGVFLSIFRDVLQ